MKLTEVIRRGCFLLSVRHFVTTYMLSSLLYLLLVYASVLSPDTMIWAWLFSAFLLSTARLMFLSRENSTEFDNNYIQMIAFQYASQFSNLDDFLNLAEDNSQGATSQEISRLPHLEASDSGSCCICIQDVEKGEQITVMPCSHTFHSSCVDEWLVQKASCPICKATLDASNVV